LRRVPKKVKFEGIFHELYKFGIVIIFHVDVKVTRQYDWHALTTSLCQNLLILHTLGEYPPKLENIKDFQSSLGVAGDTYTVTTSTFCPFTGHSAAQTSPHGSEAANLIEVFAMFCLFSFMSRRGVAIVEALSICL
jgi:hypothetical protein